MTSATSQVLRPHHLFVTLDERQFAAVEAASRLVRLDAGQILFQRGDPASHFYVVAAGQMKLFLQSRNGDEKTISTLSPGESFAEALMFAESPAYPVSAMAPAAASVIAIPNADYLALLRGSTATCMRMLADLSRRLHGHVREIEALSFENARNRLINHLLELAGGASGAITVTLAESRQELAARLAIKPETLSRTLRALTDEGSIRVDGRDIHIIAAQRLRQPAQP